MRIYKDYKLDRFQREALEAVRAGESAIVAAPTGCGKTLIAEYAIEQALERGERIIYTAPIKALSNQKFRDFGAMYGARVGIMTGDVTINPGAQAQIMTTEIFRNTIFDNPERLAGVRYVIHDEVHYLDDPERGTVWEESIIFAPPEIRFICLSATISNLDQFAAWFREVRSGRLRVVQERHRPVPLRMYVWTGEQALELDRVRGARFPRRRAHGRGGDGARPAPRHGRRRRRAAQAGLFEQTRALIDHVVAVGHLPAIVFVFSRAYVERYARSCAELDLVDRREKAALREHWNWLVREFELVEDEPGTAGLKKLLLRGIAYHHAGMLPTHKEVVERLFTSGLIKLLFATETFALGVNMPAKAVLFETLKKFDGVRRDYMKSRDFLQMAGRAGRRGIDEVGHVYASVLAEEERPAEVRAVMAGRPEEVASQFNLSYATLLKLYSHLGERIYEACQRSFAYFRHRKRKRSPFADMVSLVRRRLQLLQEQGYLEGTRLTAKGRFAAQIYGYEIQLTELFMGGLIEALPPQALATLLVAVVHESRREQWSMPLARRLLKPLQQETQRLLAPILAAEHQLRLPPMKMPDWGLARAAWEWAGGAEFAEVLATTDAQPGDVIRAFRMAIQLVRQLYKPLSGLGWEVERLEALRANLRETTARLKRGEVDAERQLRQSIHADGGDEALEHIPRERLEEEAADEPALERLLRERVDGARPPAPQRDSGTRPPRTAPAAGARASAGMFDLDREERDEAGRRPDG
ncbi:MAG: hypothetical protein KatS3mg102_0565 [Planctomycetota bacterium]|nr:MAG: hypothetical protein KatS3mg102_0565 [Planctomycetota bacterium]